MMILGLTGSIGMGKSTTTAMFAAKGVACYDADAAVHKLYAGDAVPLIEEEFPGVCENGSVNRGKLGERVLGDPEAMKRLEKIIHPLVRAEEIGFLEGARRNNFPVALLDIPLLFETGAEKRVDASIVITAAPEIQKKRVMARPGMTEERFQALLAKQMPDAEKCLRAHFQINTGLGLEAAERSVCAILRAIAGIK